MTTTELTTMDEQAELDNIVQKLNEIVERRNHYTGDNDFSFRGTSSDILEAELLICNLTPEEKSYVSRQFAFKYSSFLNFIFNKKLPQADYIPPRKHNTPVKQLLKWFTDKKSKKVGIARAELYARYDELDPKDQLAIRLALLQGNCKTDYLMGLHYCFYLWHGKELEYVQNIWQNAQSNEVWYRASRLLIRHSSDEFVISNQEKLIKFNGEVNSDLYYYLALRLYKIPSFSVQKSLLKLDKYYALLYHTHTNLNEDEWEEDIYRVVAELYFDALCRLARKNAFSAFQPRYLHAPYDHYPMRDSIIKIEQRLWGNASKRWLSILELSIISRMLRYASYMGCSRINDFVQYAHLIDQTISQQAELGLLDPTPMVVYCPIIYQHLFSEAFNYSCETQEQIIEGKKLVDMVHKFAEMSPADCDYNNYLSIVEGIKRKWDHRVYYSDEYCLSNEEINSPNILDEVPF